MSAPFRPPRSGGLQPLAPELARIVDALARVQEERDHARGGVQTPKKPEFGRDGKSPDGTTSTP